MSRRHTSSRDLHLTRVLGIALILLVVLAATLPVVAVAQDAKIRDQDVQQRWQLLTYRDANGKTESVPAGVGATLQLFSNSAFGEAACSTYDSRYTRSRETLFIDPPDIEHFECDPASQAFDDAFYQNLADTASITVSDSILTLHDSSLTELMTLTRAVIDDDPTVAHWDLARIGTAEGSIEPVIQGLESWVEFLRGGRLVGNTGCGSFLGSYTINDSTMSISDVAYRLESCTDSARRQAEQVIGTLDEITDFEVLPAGLALRDENGTMRLALAPTLDLGERTWTPIEILGDKGDTLYDADRLNTSAVKFFGKKAEGRSICGSFSGKGLTSGLALSATDIELTGKPCPKKGDSRAVESAFIGALREASSHALRGSELELKDVDGNTLMRLQPQAELVGPTWVVSLMDLTPNAAKKTKRAPKGATPLTATFEEIGVVLGDTGAADGRGSNVYLASYNTPAASTIRIWDVDIDGRACAGKKARSAACQQQKRFLDLLQSADGYIPRETDLRLLKGARPIIWFVPAVLEVVEN